MIAGKWIVLMTLVALIIGFVLFLKKYGRGE